MLGAMAIWLTGREVLQDVVGQLAVHGGVDAMRSGVAHDQRVAVRRRLGDDLGADHASGTGPILDDDLLPKRGRQPLGDESRDDVRRIARRARRDEADRPGRISVRGTWRFARQSTRRGSMPAISDSPCIDPSAHASRVSTRGIVSNAARTTNAERNCASSRARESSPRRLGVDADRRRRGEEIGPCLVVDRDPLRNSLSRAVARSTSPGSNTG